jgi:hypothetical protein
MFFVFMLGILRWEPRSIATALVAFLLYGGMVTTIFPREDERLVRIPPRWRPGRRIGSNLVASS